MPYFAELTCFVPISECSYRCPCLILYKVITNKQKQQRRLFGVLTYSSRSRVGHFACKLCPLILRSLLVQEVSLKSPNHILHSVYAHCRTIQNITEDKTRKKDGELSLITIRIIPCYSSSVHE